MSDVPWIPGRYPIAERPLPGEPRHKHREDQEEPCQLSMRCCPIVEFERFAGGGPIILDRISCSGSVEQVFGDQAAENIERHIVTHRSLAPYPL